MPEISVCITCYNHEHYIAQCLDSVLQQDGNFRLQVLVGDDGSNDATRRIVNDYAQRYPQQIVAVMQTVNLGASGNLQSLIARASGDFIAHLDGDDYWLPGKLALQLAALREAPDAIAAYCNARVVDENNSCIGFFNDDVPARFGLDYLTKCGNFLNTSSMLYRCEARQPILDIQQNFIDYRANILLAAQGDILFLAEPLVAYRWMVQNSMTSSGRDPIYQRYLDAISEAARLGASQPALDLCCRRFCRSLWYSALWPPRPQRLHHFFGQLLSLPQLTQSRWKLVKWTMLAMLQLPQVAWRHIVGAHTGQKIFFPTGQHRA